MSNYAEQELDDFFEPLPQWLKKVLWYDYSSMTDSEAWSWVDSINPLTDEQLQELNINPGWQPERYPRTADELRPEFTQILQRCSRVKWNAYRKNIKAARETLANEFAPLPLSPVGAPRKDDIAQDALRLRSAGETWNSIAIKLHQKYGAARTRESVRSLVRHRIKQSSSDMVETKN